MMSIAACSPPEHNLSLSEPQASGLLASKTSGLPLQLHPQQIFQLHQIVIGNAGNEDGGNV